MRRHLPLLALAVLAVAAAGGGAAAGVRAAGLPPEMLDVEWDLVTMQVGGQPAADVTGKGLTIMFTADGKLNGSGGCNRFIGGYTGDASGTLAIPNPLGATRIACEPAIEQRENLYFTALPEVRGYVLESPTRLRLRFDQPDWQLVYARGPSGLPQTGGGGAAEGGFMSRDLPLLTLAILAVAATVVRALAAGRRAAGTPLDTGAR